MLHKVALNLAQEEIYLATLKNYGKRLTFGFDIPEPAAFHLWAMTDANNVANAMVLKEPVKPVLASFADINEVNYKTFAAAYGVAVDTPPGYIFVSHVWKYTGSGNAEMADSATLTIPQGYQSDYIYAYRTNDENGGGHIYFFAGVQWVHNPGENSGFTQASMSGITGSLPIAISGNRNQFIATVMLKCVPTTAKMDTWKQSVFNAIISAYENKLAEYHNALEEAKAMARNERRAGTNPLMNEQIVRAELKKLCMYSFVKDAFFTDDPNEPYDYASINQLSLWNVWDGKDGFPEKPETQLETVVEGLWNVWDGKDGFPEYNLSCDAYDKFRRERLAFMEEIFDWELLVSEFLPYYYAPQPKWKKLYQLADNDPMFLNFLQAGLAKVRVPVKAGKEAAALRFWQTKAQEVPRGNEPYLFADDFIKDLLADVQEPIPTDIVLSTVNVGTEGVEDINRWIVRIPTTLVMLEESSGGITEEGLTCNCGDYVKPESLTMPLHSRQSLIIPYFNALPGSRTALCLAGFLFHLFKKTIKWLNLIPT
jgi:hypothetical protein